MPTFKVQLADAGSSIGPVPWPQRWVSA